MLASVRKLCTPAYVYLVISMISIIVLMFQNMGSNHMFCAGSYSCSVSNTMLVFTIQLIYVFFWTWLLNKLCENGASVLSWILVILPLVFMFVAIAMFLLFSTPLPSTTYRLI
jgi:hypothetical protein